MYMRDGGIDRPRCELHCRLAQGLEKLVGVFNGKCFLKVTFFISCIAKHLKTTTWNYIISSIEIENNQYDEYNY